MNMVLKAVLVGVFFVSSAWAEGPRRSADSGEYLVKDGNVVSIAGKTMVQNSETVFYDCKGNSVARMNNETYVQYEIVSPTKGPIPLLKSVKALCY